MDYSDFRGTWFFSLFIWSFYGPFSEGLHIYLHSQYHPKPNTSHTFHLHTLHTYTIYKHSTYASHHTHTLNTTHMLVHTIHISHTQSVPDKRLRDLKLGGKLNCAEFKPCLGHDLMSLGRLNYLPALILKQERGFSFYLK